MNALGKAAIGVLAVGLAAGLGYYVYERNTEQPEYRLILADGRFEVREYASLT